MTFERCRDYGLIRSIMTHPRVYQHISDDGSPDVAEFQPVESEALWYVVVRDGEKVLGLWLLVPQNSICWEIHTCLLPEAYGQTGRRAAVEMAEWIWANTPCRRLITTVPVSNLLAHRFAVRSGMREFGRNPASFLKNGALHDQILLGMSKPEEGEQCQQQ